MNGVKKELPLALFLTLLMSLPNAHGRCDGELFPKKRVELGEGELYQPKPESSLIPRRIGAQSFWRVRLASAWAQHFLRFYPVAGINLKNPESYQGQKLSQVLDQVFEEMIKVYPRDLQEKLKKMYQEEDSDVITTVSKATIMRRLHEKVEDWRETIPSLAATFQKKRPVLEKIAEAVASDRLTPAQTIFGDLGLAMVVLKTRVPQDSIFRKIMKIHEIGVHYAHYLIRLQRGETITTSPGDFAGFTELNAFFIQWVAVRLADPKQALHELMAAMKKAGPKFQDQVAAQFLEILTYGLKDYLERQVSRYERVDGQKEGTGENYQFPLVGGFISALKSINPELLKWALSIQSIPQSELR